MGAAYLGAKVQHVLKAVQTRDHTCHWPGCNSQVPPAMWGCRPHWFALPSAIRRAVWSAYVPGQEMGRPSAAYIVAAQQAQDWIRAHHPETQSCLPLNPDPQS